MGAQRKRRGMFILGILVLVTLYAHGHPAGIGLAFAHAHGSADGQVILAEKAQQIGIRITDAVDYTALAGL